MATTYKEFDEDYVKNATAIFKQGGYDVEYYETVGLFVDKKNGKYTEIRPVEYGHYGYRINITGGPFLTPEEALDLYKELEKDLAILKLIQP